MEQLAGYIATGIMSLIVGFLLQRFKSRPKLLYWVPGSFLFELNDPKVNLRTDSLTIQNDGRETAHSIEIVHKYRPDHFQFSVPVAFSEETTPNGEHVIKIPSLGPKELVTGYFDAKTDAAAKPKVQDALEKLGTVQDTLFQLREELSRLQDENSRRIQSVAATLA